MSIHPIVRNIENICSSIVPKTYKNKHGDGKIKLSIVINTWSGSDVYRFRIQLETLMFGTSNYRNYLELCKCLMNRWDRGITELEDESILSKLPCVFERFRFQFFPCDTSNFEIIIANDGEMSPKLEKCFESFCEKYDIRNKQIIKTKAQGYVALMRNLAFQLFRGEAILFRDDDDYSAPIHFLLKDYSNLEKLNFGKNGTEYWDEIEAWLLKRDFTKPVDLYNEISKHQKHPTIASYMNCFKLKNTWGSAANPFGQTELPVNINKIELVDKASSAASMCNKIFSREAVKFLHNSVCLNALEDNRAFHTEILVQNNVWFLDYNRLTYLKKTLDMKWFVRYMMPMEGIPEDTSFLRKIVNEKAFVSSYKPFFAYVLASGSFSRDSWAYAGVVSLLENIRWQRNQVNFTIKELRKLKEIITSAIKTTLIDVNCVSEVKALEPSLDELAKHLETIINYKYIFWHCVVHNSDDYDMLLKELESVRKIVEKTDLSKIPKHENADKIRGIVIHPDTKISENLYASPFTKPHNRNNLDELNYTEYI